MLPPEVHRHPRPSSSTIHLIYDPQPPPPLLSWQPPPITPSLAPSVVQHVVTRGVTTGYTKQSRGPRAERGPQRTAIADCISPWQQQCWFFSLIQGPKVPGYTPGWSFQLWLQRSIASYCLTHCIKYNTLNTVKRIPVFSWGWIKLHGHVSHFSWIGDETGVRSPWSPALSCIGSCWFLYATPQPRRVTFQKSAQAWDRCHSQSQRAASGHDGLSSDARSSVCCVSDQIWLSQFPAVGVMRTQGRFCFYPESHPCGFLVLCLPADTGVSHCRTCPPGFQQTVCYRTLPFSVISFVVSFVVSLKNTYTELVSSLTCPQTNHCVSHWSWWGLKSSRLLSHLPFCSPSHCDVL